MKLKIAERQAIAANPVVWAHATVAERLAQYDAALTAAGQVSPGRLDQWMSVLPIPTVSDNMVSYYMRLSEAFPDYFGPAEYVRRRLAVFMAEQTGPRGKTPSGGLIIR